MKNIRRSRHKRIACRHRKQRSSKTAGIQRTVCSKCGHVTVDYLFNVFAEERLQPNGLPQT